MPDNYPPYQTCHRRFQRWIREGKLEEALKLLARHLHDQGKLNLDEAFVDATFASAKRGSRRRSHTPGQRHEDRRCRRWLQSSTRRVCPERFAGGVPSCRRSPRRSFLDELPARQIGDKAYDSNALNATLKSEYGIEMIAPNRLNRGKTQDGRTLRRYRKRWKVERLFAWMHAFRRLVTRWEYHIDNFLGMVQLACLHMLLRRL